MTYYCNTPFVTIFYAFRAKSDLSVLMNNAILTDN